MKNTAFALAFFKSLCEAHGVKSVQVGKEVFQDIEAKARKEKISINDLMGVEVIRNKNIGDNAIELVGPNGKTIKATI